MLANSLYILNLGSALKLARLLAICLVLSVLWGCEDSTSQDASQDSIDQSLALDQELLDQEITEDAKVQLDQTQVSEPVLPSCEDGAVVYCEHSSERQEALESEALSHCALPRRTCLQQEWSDCAYPTERCDGLDNDCDGQSDEGYDLGESCEAGVGECRREGSKICSPQGLSICSIAATDPHTERCDGLDNDCDGVSDEDFGDLGSVCQVDTGICLQEGTMICNQLGTHSICSVEPLEPQVETCDGLDNDCDYRVDEQLAEEGQSCVLAEFNPEQPALVGACALGTQSCQNGAWTCLIETEAETEVCDGLDNDCDGYTDEDGPVLNTVCETQFRGVCRLGVWGCSAAQNWQCEALNEPSTEICDLEDNDCDGEIDESDPNIGQSCETELLGTCTAGRWICIQGALICEALRDTQTEVCDGLDNDCDGVSDEDVSFDRDLCDTRERGICREGHPRCQDGSIVCQRNLEPSPELCDDLDNDCDGRSDEDFPALGTACAVGQGACLRQGIMGCDLNNEVAVCLARPAEPSPEICDLIDNDCDGIIDNTVYPPSSVEHCGECGTACIDSQSQRAACYGTQCALSQCQAGFADTNQDPSDGCEAVCIPTTLSIEHCDSVDNDCDGLIDESERCRFGEAFDYCLARQDLGLEDEVCDTFNTLTDHQEWWPTPSDHPLFPSSKALIKQDVLSLGLNAQQETGALQRRLPPLSENFELSFGIRPPSVTSTLGQRLDFNSPPTKLNTQLSFSLEHRPKVDQLIESDQWVGQQIESEFSLEEQEVRKHSRRLLSLWIDWNEGYATISIKQGLGQQLLWQAPAPQLDLDQVRSGEIIPVRWLRTAQAEHHIQVDGVYLVPSFTETLNQSKTYNVGIVWINHVDLTNHDAEEPLTTSVFSPELSHFSLRFDHDGDALYPPYDNCIFEYNPEQIDNDQNGSGLACDDPDQDGIEGQLDNCPRVYNPTQDDFDDNGQGDHCEGEGELVVMGDRAGVAQAWRYRLGHGWVEPLPIPPATKGEQISINSQGDIAYIVNSELFLKRSRGDEVSFGEGFAEILFIGQTLYSIDIEQRILRRHEVVEEANDLIPALTQSYETASGFQISFAGGLDAEGVNERIFLWELGQALGSGEQGIWLIESNRSGTLDYSLGPIFDDPTLPLPSISIHPSLPKALLASEQGDYTGVWSLDLSSGQLNELSSVPTKAVLWWQNGGVALTLRSGHVAYELAETEAQAQALAEGQDWLELDGLLLKKKLFGQGAKRAPQELSQRGILAIHQDINNFENSRSEMVDSGDHLLALSLSGTPSRMNLVDTDDDGLPNAFDICSAQELRDDLQFTEYPWLPTNALSTKLNPQIDGMMIDWINASKQRFLSSVDANGQELTRLNYNNIGRRNCYHTPYSEGYHAWMTWVEGDYWFAYVDCFTDEDNFQLHWLSDNGQYDPPWRSPVDTSQVVTRDVSSNNNTHFYWDGEVMRALYSDYQNRYIWNFAADGTVLSAYNSGHDLNHGHAYYNQELGLWRDLGMIYTSGRDHSALYTVQTNGYTVGWRQIGPYRDCKNSGTYTAATQIFHGSGVEYSVYINKEDQVIGYWVRSDGYASVEGEVLVGELEEVYRLYGASGTERHALLVYGRDQLGDGLFALTFNHNLQQKSPLIRLSSLGSELIQKPSIHQVGKRWVSSWFEANRGLISVTGRLECAQ